MKLYKAKGQGIFVNNVLRIDTINSLDNDILLVKYKDGNEVVVDNYNIIADPKAKMEKVSDVVANLPKASDRITENIIINDIQIGDIIEIDGDVIIVDENILNMINSFDRSNKLDILGDGSCIACYQFDGNANDLSGNYNGVWDGTEQYEQGVFGQAAKFDGNSNINIDNFPLSKIKSISLWVNKLTNDDYNDFFGIENDDNPDAFILSYTNNGFSLEINNNQEQYNPFYIPELNRWYFITITIDSSKTNIYLNGSLIKIYNETPNLVDGMNFNIGSESSNAWRLKNGLIDQVRIFNKVLSEEEVKKIYQESSKLIKKII
jgi:hypothetical protein